MLNCIFHKIVKLPTHLHKIEIMFIPIQMKDYSNLRIKKLIIILRYCKWLVCNTKIARLSVLYLFNKNHYSWLYCYISFFSQTRSLPLSTYIFSVCELSVYSLNIFPTDLIFQSFNCFGEFKAVFGNCAFYIIGYDVSTQRCLRNEFWITFYKHANVSTVTCFCINIYPTTKMLLLPIF